MKQYSKYKETGISWLGKVPEHWQIKKLKYLLRKKITDGPHETPKFIDAGIPFLSVDSIQDGKIVFDGCRFISKEAHELYKKKCVVEKNDVLMGKAASIGKIAKVNVDFEFGVWSPLAIIKANNIIDPSYLEYSLKSPQTQYQIEILCTSNTQKNISMDDIPKIILTFPDLQEQHTILNYLNKQTQKINSLIEKRKQMIGLLNEQHSAIINHTVTKGINLKAKMKDSGVEWIGEIPENWKVNRLFSLGRFSKGKGILREDLTLEGKPAITYGDIYTKYNFKIDKVKNFISALTSNKCVSIHKGTLLFTGSGETVEDIGKTVVYNNNEPAFVGGDIITFIPEKQDSEFLSYSLNSNFARFQKSSFARGEIIVHISASKLKNVYLPIPSITEQQQIVKHIEAETSKIDKTLSKIEKEIALLQEYKTALISEAVTGKIDVRGDKNA